MYSLHHKHSENFQDQLVRMQRAKQDPGTQTIQLHELDTKPVYSWLHELL